MLLISTFAFWTIVLSVLGLIGFCSLGALVLIVREKNRSILDEVQEPDEYKFMYERGVGS